MSAFKITHISSIDENHSQSISFQLNSSEIPYEMQKNFIVMEKIPDYLFHYITLMFFDNKFQKTYELNKSSKSINNNITETTFDTNQPDFFKLIKKILYTFEEHFSMIVIDFQSFDNYDNFLQKINKFHLYDTLQNKLIETKQPEKKNKI